MSAGHLRKRDWECLEDKASATGDIKAVIKTMGKTTKPASKATMVSASTIIIAPRVMEKLAGR